MTAAATNGSFKSRRLFTIDNVFLGRHVGELVELGGGQKPGDTGGGNFGWEGRVVRQSYQSAHEASLRGDAVRDFMRFTGIERPEEFRTVTRAHVIAWRDDLKTRLTKRSQPWNDSSIRHRLAALGRPGNRSLIRSH